MKTILSLAIALAMEMNVNAQKINLVGTWNEVEPNQNYNQVLNESVVVRTWIFNADGTKTMKGRQQLTYPIGGINCTFDIIQSRTDEKWTLNGKTLTMEAIPLNKLTINVDYQKYGNYTAAQKQKINAGIPAFRQQAIKETRQGWRSFVGHICTYTISSYNPKQMVLDLNGNEFVLVRDLTKMPPAQKAQFDKDVVEYEARIQKEKEMREAAKREAEENRIKAENEYWTRIGIEKKNSADKAAAESVKLVDLGLSVRWADRNIGATSPEDNGFMYKWGEITSSRSSGRYKPVRKPHKKDKLDASNDPATARWGVGFHVPSPEQWEELLQKCVREVRNNVLIITGPNGNSISIPIGNSISIPIKTAQNNVHYWSNAMSDTSNKDAILFYFKGASYCQRPWNVESMYPVRAVME